MDIRKKVVLILGKILFLGLMINVNAQEKISTYSMSALDNNKNTDFEIGLDDENALWIDVFSAYQPGVRCGFKLDERYKPNFITTVKEAGNLYTEWKNWAVENNVQDIQKKMHYIFYTQGYFSYFDKVKHDDNVRVIFAFTYFKGDYVLIMNLEEMTASDNDQITFNGGTIVFNSENEIDNFIDSILPQSISNLKASKQTLNMSN